MPLPIGFSEQSRRTGDSPISFFMETAIQTPGLISLAAGLVDAPSLPAAPVAEAVARIMADPKSAQAALQYGTTPGLPALRRRIADRVAKADGTASFTADDVVLTTGSQQMLYILGELLFDPGDIVVCEAPSYFVYHDCLKSHGARVLSVPMDAGGMSLTALDDLLARLEAEGDLPKVKLLYTVDYYQNPTGLSLAADRRPKLVEIAKKYSKTHRILVLEDAAYRELRYEGDDLPSVKSFDAANDTVVYTSTFSKPCAPGLKTGYSILPKGLATPVCNLKGNHDFGSTNLAQHVLNQLLETGAFDEHVTNLQGVYRGKKNAMLRALEAEFADWPEVRWTRPAGGLYVWVTFPPHVRTGQGSQLLRAALEAKVLHVPGELGHVPDEFGHVPRNEARLSFGVASEAEITEGVRRLRSACRGLEAPTAAREPALA